MPAGEGLVGISSMELRGAIAVGWMVIKNKNGHSGNVELSKMRRKRRVGIELNAQEFEG